MNNRLGKNLDQREADDTVYKDFYRRKRKRTRRFRKRCKQDGTANKLFEKVCKLFKNNTDDIGYTKDEDEESNILSDIHRLFDSNIPDTEFQLNDSINQEMLDEINKLFYNLEEEPHMNEDENEVKKLMQATTLITGEIPQLDLRQTKLLGDRALDEMSTSEIPHKILMMIIDITTDKLQKKQNTQKKKVRSHRTCLIYSMSITE